MPSAAADDHHRWRCEVCPGSPTSSRMPPSPADPSSRHTVVGAHATPGRHQPSRNRHAEIVGGPSARAVGSSRFGRRSARPAIPSRKTPLLIVGGIAAVAALVAAIFVFSGGERRAARPRRRRRHPRDARLRLRRSKKDRSSRPRPSADQKKAATAAEPASDAVAKALDDPLHRSVPRPRELAGRELRRRARAFSDDARDEAEQQLDLLTAGTEVGDLDTIRPMPTTLKTEVLIDPEEPALVRDRDREVPGQRDRRAQPVRVHQPRSVHLPEGRR